MNLLTRIFKKKDEPLRNDQDFWTWFEKNEKTFSNVIRKHDNIERNFFEKIAPKLAELKDGFYFLTGMYDDKTAELILTPDGVIKNIVFVEQLVDSAPKISGWRFTALKPALEIENVTIEMAGYVFGRQTLSFYAKEYPNYPDQIDVVIVHKNYTEKDKATTEWTIYFP